MIYFYILEEHGAFQVSLVAYLVPIVATLVSLFVLGEAIGALTLVGFGLVATGFALLKRRAIADLRGPGRAWDGLDLLSALKGEDSSVGNPTS